MSAFAHGSREVILDRDETIALATAIRSRDFASAEAALDRFVDQPNTIVAEWIARGRVIGDRQRKAA